MKRASDVPPVVESFGFRPVTSAMASTARSVNGPGLVTKTSAFDGSHSIVKSHAPAGGVLRALLDQRLERILAVTVVEADVETRARFAGNQD